MNKLNQLLATKQLNTCRKSFEKKNKSIKNVRLGSIFLSDLFNIYCKAFLRLLRMSLWLITCRNNLNNIRYADDTMLMTKKKAATPRLIIKERGKVELTFLRQHVMVVTLRNRPRFELRTSNTNRYINFNNFVKVMEIQLKMCKLNSTAYRRRCI